MNSIISLLIPNICEGLPFEENDFVLLNFWGDNQDLEIIDLISENLSKKGVISSRHQCSNSFFEKVVLNLIRNNVKIPQEHTNYLSSFKYVVDIFMYPPSLSRGISELEIPRFKEYLGQLFNALTKDKKYYIQLNVPTEINASKAGLDFDTYNSALCNALSVDFPKLKNVCREHIKNLKDKNNIVIRTGEKYLLKLDIINRKWYADDGCGDLPAGEVYIAPIEGNSNGDILIPMINLRGEVYKNVLMTFQNGRFIKSSSDELNDFFNTLPENYKILLDWE